jgi:hypothetical protein
LLDETLESSAAGSVDAPAVAPTRHTGIAILGSHPATVMAAPFGDPSWRIYSCSPHNIEQRTLPRWDQWFEVHDTIEDPTRAFVYLKAVSEMPFVWMRDQRALASGRFPGARPYPEKELKGTSAFQEIKAPTGTFRKVQGPDGQPAMAEVMERRRTEIPNSDGLFSAHMFTSSIAYMLAKAIVDCEREGIPQIGLWGIMQASEGEYAYQRPGIQYFLWEAMKRGIKVIANRESCLFDMPQWKW